MNLINLKTDIKEEDQLRKKKDEILAKKHFK